MTYDPKLRYCTHGRDIGGIVSPGQYHCIRESQHGDREHFYIVTDYDVDKIDNFAKKYRDMRRSKETLCKLIAQSLHDTIQVDGYVGGAIKLAIIQPTGARVIEDSVTIRGYIDDPWINR